ncbi:MAG: MBL fold metallo-hydrolase, partial [Myxococcota bacterium]|nr:MBL fold metallo-hydrolase [Myxococcota bacterium]
MPDHAPARREERYIRFGLGLILIALIPLWALSATGSPEKRPLHEVKERAWDFPKTPVVREEIEPGIWRATGVSNSYLVEVPEGYVLIDSGLPHQARKQKALLEEVMEDKPLLFIVLTHSHIDHAGGAKLWRADHPGARIVAHESFVPMQRTLVELGPYFGKRGAMAMPNLVSATARSRDTDPLLTGGNIKPDLLIDDDQSLTLDLKGKQVEILPMPGGEGADGLTVWLPKEEILFTGDLTGPHFPAFPNLYSVRGERYREFLPYIRSVDQAIKLNPRVIAHGHFDVIRDREYIREALTRQRDAVQYVHDQTVEGMNQGKGLYELMATIQLPPELALSEGYGRVMWSVRALWETYTGWFDFESTTSLYPVTARQVYP